MREDFVSRKFENKSSKDGNLRPSQALRFRIDRAGDLRATVSASSGEFVLSPEIIEILCLIQKGERATDLSALLKSSYKQRIQNLPDPSEIAGLLEDMQAAQCLVSLNETEKDRGIEDGFADPWIQWAMLSDAPRCRGYRAALEESVDINSHILDVGAGSGLLSLYALELGATKVDAIEETSVAGVLKKVRAQLPEKEKARFTVHNCNSFDARLPRKITHIVSELFGNDPLQEGVIPTLRDIFSRVGSDKCQGIPDSFSVYTQLVDVRSGPLHHRMKRFAEPSKSGDEQWFKAVRRIKAVLPFAEVSFAHPVRSDDLALLSPLKRAWEVSLAPPPSNNAPLPQKTFTFCSDANAAAPALLVGFRAHLTEHITLSNLPGERDCCEHWSPIAIPLSRRLCKGETLKIHISVSEHWDRVTAKVTDSNSHVLGLRT
jgi:predicted RNA methylase